MKRSTQLFILLVASLALTACNVAATEPDPQPIPTLAITAETASLPAATAKPTAVATEPTTTASATVTPVVVPTQIPTEEPPMLTLYRFDSPSTAGEWYIVNDDVMGGVSTSSLALTADGTVLFSGNVSLENNGGFASVRTALSQYGISDEQGIRLMVRGDGRTYRLQINVADNRNVTFEAPFETNAGEWETIDLPFSSFVPTIRGRVLTGQNPLNPPQIFALGLTIRDSQSGTFALEVASIEAYE